MPIAAAASNALKSQKAKANQQEAKTKAGVDPELLYFFLEPKSFPRKCGPKPFDCTSRALSTLTSTLILVSEGILLLQN